MCIPHTPKLLYDVDLLPIHSYALYLLHGVSVALVISKVMDYSVLCYYGIIIGNSCMFNEKLLEPHQFIRFIDMTVLMHSAPADRYVSDEHYLQCYSVWAFRQLCCWLTHSIWINSYPAIGAATSLQPFFYFSSSYFFIALLLQIMDFRKTCQINGCNHLYCPITLNNKNRFFYLSRKRVSEKKNGEFSLITNYKSLTIIYIYI